LSSNLAFGRQGKLFYENQILQAESKRDEPFLPLCKPATPVCVAHAESLFFKESLIRSRASYFLNPASLVLIFLYGVKPIHFSSSMVKLVVLLGYW
jgi:hypothetical protein